MQNRRKSVRVKIDRAALIKPKDGSFSIACTMRDISARGARLLLDRQNAGDSLPDIVVLHLPDDGSGWLCQIVRRRGNELGIQFV